MKKVFIIHGIGGMPNNDWLAWLSMELGKRKIWASVPAFPVLPTPKLNEWMAEIKRVIGKSNAEIFLVGHSLGVPAVLNYLENLPVGESVGGAILVAGFAHSLKDNKYRIIDNFVNKNFDFEKIKKSCKKFTVIHGDDDSVVPFSEAVGISKNLGCELVSVSHGGHLCELTLPEALEALEKMMK